MRTITTTFVTVLFVLMPLAGLAQQQPAGIGPANIPGFTMPTTTEPVSHGETTIDLGVIRRFDESPKALRDLDLPPGRVINKSRLHVYTRHIMLTEPITKLDVGDRTIRATVQDKATVLGFIPARATYDVEIDFDNGIEAVETTVQGRWWHSFADFRPPEAISKNIKAGVTRERFLSRTHVKAFILDAIAKSVSVS